MTGQKINVPHSLGSNTAQKEKDDSDDSITLAICGSLPHLKSWGHNHSWGTVNETFLA